MDHHLKEYLDKHSARYRLYKHPAVFTVEQSRDICKHIPGLRTKSLFLVSGKSYYLVCMPGEKRLNIKALKQQLNIKELHFASPAELKKELHLSPGSVTPLGILQAEHTTLLIDNDVWHAKDVGFHPNINTETLVLSHTDFEKFYQAVAAPKHMIDLPLP